MPNRPLRALMRYPDGVEVEITAKRTQYNSSKDGTLNGGLGWEYTVDVIGEGAQSELGALQDIIDIIRIGVNVKNGRDPHADSDKVTYRSGGQA